MCVILTFHPVLCLSYFPCNFIKPKNAVKKWVSGWIRAGLSIYSHITSDGEETRNNTLTFLNSAAALKEQGKPDIRLSWKLANTKYCSLSLGTAPPTGTKTESNPDLTPPGGQSAKWQGTESHQTGFWILLLVWQAFIKTTTIPRAERGREGIWITTWEWQYPTAGNIIGSCLQLAGVGDIRGRLQVWV